MYFRQADAQEHDFYSVPPAFVSPDLVTQCGLYLNPFSSIVENPNFPRGIEGLSPIIVTGNKSKTAVNKRIPPVSYKMVFPF